MPGETLNNQLNLNKHKISLYAHIYEKHVEIKNVDGTVDITPDKYTWYMGGVVLEFVDYRSQPTCSGKRILLKQNTASLWDDVLRMNKTAGGTWTQEMAIQVESQLLLAMHPTIDLDPNSTLQGMKRYDPADGPVEPVHRELKTRKRKLNSYELEQEAAKKAKKEQMMFMMDERHGREFKPTFKLLPYFKSNRNKVSAIGKGKQRADETIEQGRGSSTPAKKPVRKFFRQLGFERSSTYASDKVNKVFTLLKIYQEAVKYEAIFHSLNEKDLRAENKYQTFIQMMTEGKEYKLDDNRATYRNELENAEAYKAFIKSFVVLYSIDNNLKYDSERADKVTVEMLTEVTTELASPQTEMKFDNMQPYKIVELLAQQPDAERPTSTNEGVKDLSVADLYNAAAKKAMQTKPTISTPVAAQKRTQRPRQPSITKGQVTAPLGIYRTGNQTSVQQQHAQMQQPQAMAASQSPSQQPIRSPVIVQQNATSTDGTRPAPQQIPIPTIARQVPVQIPNVPRMPMNVQLIQRQMTVQPNVQAIQNVAQGHPNVRQIPGRIISTQGIQNISHGMSNFQGINVTQVNTRPVVNQSVAQGTTIQDTITSPSMLNTRQKGVTARKRSTQGQPQQMSVPTQQTAQINIPTQTSSSQMNQMQATTQINIPTQPTDPTRVTSQLNIQNQMNQVQSTTQINIPAQISDQNNIQQTQTTPRINPGRVTPRLNAQTQMNQAQSAPQINIPAQVSTPRINPAQVPQVNVTDQMNAMNQARMNQRMAQSTDQNGSARINQGRQISIQQLAAFAAQNPNIQLPPQVQVQVDTYNAHVLANSIAAQQMRPNNNGFIRHPMMNMQSVMQQPFMQSGQNIVMPSSFPMQNQLLPGQQQSGIRPQMRAQLLRGPQGIPHMLLQRQAAPATPMIPQQLAVNQQLMNGGQWIYQNQPPQQPQNLQNPPWSGNRGKQ